MLPPLIALTRRSAFSVQPKSKSSGNAESGFLATTSPTAMVMASPSFASYRSGTPEHGGNRRGASASGPCVEWADHTSGRVCIWSWLGLSFAG